MPVYDQLGPADEADALTPPYDDSYGVYADDDEEREEEDDEELDEKVVEE